MGLAVRAHGRTPRKLHLGREFVEAAVTCGKGGLAQVP